MDAELVTVWNGTIYRQASLAETRPAPDEPPELSAFARRIVLAAGRTWQTTKELADRLGVSTQRLHKDLYLPLLVQWDYLEVRVPREHRKWWGKTMHHYRRGRRLLQKRTPRAKYHRVGRDESGGRLPMRCSCGVVFSVRRSRALNGDVKHCPNCRGYRGRRRGQAA